MFVAVTTVMSALLLFVGVRLPTLVNGSASLSVVSSINNGGGGYRIIVRSLDTVNGGLTNRRRRGSE